MLRAICLVKPLDLAWFIQICSEKKS